MPIAKNNIKRPSSRVKRKKGLMVFWQNSINLKVQNLNTKLLPLYEFFSVNPSDCNPVECLANLRIRRILITRKICTTLLTSWNWSLFECSFACVSISDTKNGSIASRSITFKAPINRTCVCQIESNLNN